MTDSFDPHNKEHQDIKVVLQRSIHIIEHVQFNEFSLWCKRDRAELFQAEIEIGNGLPDTRLTGQCIEALKQAGFEVSCFYEVACIKVEYDC